MGRGGAPSGHSALRSADVGAVLGGGSCHGSASAASSAGDSARARLRELNRRPSSRAPPAACDASASSRSGQWLGIASVAARHVRCCGSSALVAASAPVAVWVAGSGGAVRPRPGRPGPYSSACRAGGSRANAAATPLPSAAVRASPSASALAMAGSRIGWIVSAMIA